MKQAENQNISNGDVKQLGTTVRYLSPKYYKTIKLFLILGCVLNTLFVFLAIIIPLFPYLAYVDFFVILIISSFVQLVAGITILTTCLSLRKISISSKYRQLILPGIFCLINVSIIGGLLILLAGKSEFETTTIRSENDLSTSFNGEVSFDKLLYSLDGMDIHSSRKMMAKKISNMYEDFSSKEYLPSDKVKARQLKDELIVKIENASKNELIDICLSYQEYLLNFKIDHDFYVNYNKNTKAKKKKKALITLSSIVVGCAAITGMVFGVLSFTGVIKNRMNEKNYQIGISHMEKGDYGGSAEYFIRCRDYKDSECKLSIGSSLNYLIGSSGTEEDISMVVEEIVRAGEEVEITYDYNYSKNHVNLYSDYSTDEEQYVEVIGDIEFEYYYPPEKPGYIFQYWTYESVYYKDSLTHLTLQANWWVI